jgi:hypothetical protein
MLVLAGCAAQTEQTAPSTAYPAPAQTQMAQGSPESESQNCRDFTAQVMVGGQPQQTVGRACRQPDGSWQVTQNMPGVPQLVYTLPPQAIHLYPYSEPYYYWDPWFYGGPVFVGRPVFVVHGFHRFHHHDGFHGGFPHGGSPHGGFAHGGFHGGRR